MCGIFGVCGYKEAALSCIHGLYYLQHRGEKQWGISTTQSQDYNKFNLIKKMGKVEATEEDLSGLKGNIAIGHVRYPTAGPANLDNAQPHIIMDPPLMYCANGDIVNYTVIRSSLEKKGIYFASRNDGELEAKFLAYLIQCGKNPIEAIIEMMNKIEGAFSSILVYKGKMYAFRDPMGIRPIVYGMRRNNGHNSWIVSSESCGLDVIKARFIREINPAEIVVFSPDREPKSYDVSNKIKRPKKKFSHCVFECIYFARPESWIFNLSVYRFRKLLGIYLARQMNLSGKNDSIVGSVPDSSNVAALGFHQESGIPLEFILIRHHSTGRTFIASKEERNEKARLKYNPVRTVIKDMNINVVDDSIVRGTTSRKIVRMIKNAGAKTVNLCISSPPIRFPCYYGIDTPTKNELIASSARLYDIKQIQNFVEADHLEYLTIENLKNVIRDCGQDPENFCFACMDGKYPTKLPSYKKSSAKGHGK
ncbi:MAG: amidophosphoribosyltransferase [Thermodesulfovibrionales bacterium]